MVSILLISCCNVCPSPVSFGAPARWPHELENPILILAVVGRLSPGFGFQVFALNRMVLVRLIYPQ